MITYLKRLWLKWEKIIEKFITAIVSLAKSPRTTNYKLQTILMKRKLLWISLLIILIGLPIIYLSLRYQSKTEAAWYNDQWTYRQTVAITNSGSAQTDYQVSIGVGTSALIVSGKMQSDCDDIRITDINGKVLPYWIETGTNGCNAAGNSTNVWVKIPSISTSGVTLYVYYGNSQAQSTVDGNQVFIFFDDFNSNSLNTAKWNSTSGTPTFSGGVMTIPAGAYVASTTFNIAGQTNASMEGRVKVGASGTARANFGTAPSANFGSPEMGGSWLYGFNHLWYTNGSTFQETSNGTHTETSWFTYTTNWNRISLKWLSGTSVAFTSEGNTATKSTNIPTTSTAFYPHMNSYQTTTLEVDFVFVRKYASTEPSVAAPANEEKTVGPVGYWKFDEGQGQTVNDYSSSNNNGTLGATSSSGETTDPSWLTEDSCVSGKCLRFFASGNATYTKHTTINNLAPVNAITVSVWVRTSQSFDGGIISKTDLSSHNGDYTLALGGWGQTGKINWYINEGDAGEVVHSSITVNDGKWHYIVGTYDKSNLKIYIDGVLRGTQAQTADITTTYNQVYIGSYYSASYSFKGDLDEPKIYNYARSAAQVKSDYSSRGSVKGTSASMGSNAKNSSTFSNGLVGYWKLDETASPALDSSGIGTTGIWNNNVTSTNGRYGIGASFDSVGDNISISSSNIRFGPSNNFTMAAWFYKTGDKATNSVFTQQASSNNFNYGIRGGSDGTFTAWVGKNGVGSNAATSTSTYSLNTWYHAVGIFDGNTITLYINGEKVTSTAYTYGSISSADGSTAIGNDSDDTSVRGFKGKVDETRLYNRALSPKEVRDLYNWAPGPVGYWDFEEGSGNSANDKSTNGNTGTWNGTGAKHWDIGKYGKAGKFDGSSDYLSLSTPSNFNFTQPATIESWIKTSSDTCQAIFSIGKSTDVTLHQDISIGDGCTSTLTNELITLGRNSNGHRMGYTTATRTELFDDKWHHISVTYSGSTAILYIDGIPKTITVGQGTNDGLWGNISGVDKAYIGAYFTGASYANGQVDEVKIYNYVRTQKQIVEDMNAGHPNVGSPIASAVGHWKMDEGYGTKVTNFGNGGNTLDGTLGTGASAPTWTINGKYGKALSFDGTDDYVNTNVSAPGSGGYTFSAWAKTTDLSTDRKTVVGSSSGGRHDIYIDDATPKCRTWDTSEILITSSKTVSSGEWVHLVCTMDFTSGGVYFFVNGVLQGSSTRIPITAGGTMYIGDSGSSVANNFNGIIDDVKFYPYVLTENEVKLDYNRGSSMVLGTLSVNTGNTAPSSAASQEYCIPGDSTSCVSPVGRWDFEEGIGSTAYDSSGNGNVGYWNGTLGSQWTIGKAGKAGNFNGGNNFVDMGDPASGILDMPTSDFTLSAWFKTTGIVEAAIVGKRSGREGGTSGYAIHISDTGRLYGRMRDDTAGLQFVILGPSGTLFNDGQWHYVTMVVDRDTQNNNTLYVDGKKLTVSYSGNVTDMADLSTATAFRIAAIGTGYYFAGSVDQVRLYNYIRTPAQIAWDYNRGAPVGWWKFDEGQGTSIADVTGNGNTGSINIGGSGTQTSAGTITTASTAWGNGVTGKFNYSLNFDGNDDEVNVADATALDMGTSDWSFNMWIKTTDTGDGSNVAILDKRESGTNWKGWALYMNTSQKAVLQFMTQSGSSAQESISTTSINTGNWINITGTLDRDGNQRIYINGILEDSDSISSYSALDQSTASSLKMGIKSASASGLTPYNGQIDDVKIYNYALTADQVKNLYNGGSAINFGPSSGAP